MLVAFAPIVLIMSGSARADFYFGQAQSLGISGGAAWVSADDRELYFASTGASGSGDYDIWVSTRPSPADPWGPAVNLGGPVNGANTNEVYQSLSPDGLTLYFSDYFGGVNAAVDRPGGLGGHDIWMSTRASRDAPWSKPVNPGEPVNSSTEDISPAMSRDGLTLVFASERPGGSGNYDLWMCTRPTMQAPWGSPVNLGPNVNSSSIDTFGNLSADGLVLVFESNRPGGLGGYDVWMTRRKSVNDPWEPAVNLGPTVNSARDEGSGAISANGRMLYFNSTGAGLCGVPILPIVDFDGDGLVGMGDLLAMIESWGKDDPQVDLGPYPWGDGKVDANDLQVLMSYWGQEVLNPALAAYWRLDETEGPVAADSAGSNNGTLVGDPVWQPAGGQIKGALQLDGVDDYAATPFVIDPSVGPFSVFAWIKGGAAGQVIVSQADGASWLAAGATGALRTGITDSHGTPVACSTVIVDGQWHQVGLIWDGAKRALYVDGIEVAKDRKSIAGPAMCTGGLYIGAGSKQDAGSFWSGLIDDVRVYDRAVKP